LPGPRDAERPGPKCYCGQSGCIETFLSGPGFSRDYQARTGVALPAVDIGQAAEAGEQAAADCLDAYKDRLARSLATLINILDPDAIVLGGGLSNIRPLYEGLASRIEAYAFSDGINTSVLQAVHGDSSGVRGAAWLWPTQKEAN
jgi:fructokinase